MWRGEQRLVSVFLDAYVGTLGQVIAPQIAQRKCEEHFQNCQWSPVRYHFGYWCQGRFLVRNMPGNYKGACENVTDLCRVCALLCSLMRRRLHSCCPPPSLLACFGYFGFLLFLTRNHSYQGSAFKMSLKLWNNQWPSSVMWLQKVSSSSDSNSRPVWRVQQWLIRNLSIYFSSDSVFAMFVGPCHHGMARPHVADGGTASDMEDSCE